MKKIIQIAKLELSLLFYSPIAWLLLIVFFIQCGLMYTDLLKIFATYQELGGQYKEALIYLTNGVFGNGGLTYTISTNLYLYLPLLTMGLISREISSGTIKLLYSSPIRTKDIVMGKFLAISVYSLLLTLVVSIFMMAGLVHLNNADKGLMLAILLGVFLLLMAYGAIGLFLSSLTSYQVVAAISTFVLFGFLNYLRNAWQDIDFVRDLTYSISLAGRINDMASGLITTKDLFYYAIIIMAFLAFTILKLQGTRSTDSTLIKTLKYLAVIVLVVVFGYITSRPTYTGYLDATETKTRTLTKNTQAIVKAMKEGPLEITSYINLLDGHFWDGMPVSRNIDLDRWLPYIRFKPDITLKYVYYYDSVYSPDFYKQYPKQTIDQIAENFAKSFGLDMKIFKKPAEIRKMIDLTKEQNRYVMQLKYNGKSTFLRLFDDPIVFPTERETSAALKRLTSKLPKIAFLQGELERSPSKSGDKDYKMITSQINFRYSLVNQGFDFISISLKDHDIPKDVSALAIADPKAAFAPEVLGKIQQFIDGGGNLLIAGEPGKQNVLNPLLEKFGIRMSDGLIVQPSDDFSPNTVFTHLTPYTAAFTRTMTRVYLDSNIIAMPTVSGLLYNQTGKWKVQPLLQTNENKSWRKRGELSGDSSTVSFTANDGDEKGKFNTMLALSRKMPDGKQQRIVISGDADFMSSAELSRYQPVTRNFVLNTDLFGWLSNGTFPIDVTRPESKDQKVNIKGSDIRMVKVLLIGIMPLIILLAGAILLIRRKRQ